MRKYISLFILSVPMLLLYSGGKAIAANSGDSAVQARQDGWIHVSSGARPAYVGIQGGTAPISLSFSADGSVFAFTGHSGNDFTKILNKRPPEPATAPEVHSGTTPTASSDQKRQKGSTLALMPVGLGGPVAEADLQPLDFPAKDAASRQFKPLKLGSYKRLLRNSG